MNTTRWTLVSALVLWIAWGFSDAGARVETPISADILRFAPAPSAEAEERHAAVTFLIAGGRVEIRNVKVGSGPSRAYARGNKPIKIELIDRSGKPFDQIDIDDPRLLRVYHSTEMLKGAPHGVAALKEAEATIVIALDPRLDAMLVIVEARDRGRLLPLRDAIAAQCERDDSEACRSFVRSR